MRPVFQSPALATVSDTPNDRRGRLETRRAGSLRLARPRSSRREARGDRWPKFRAEAREHPHLVRVHAVALSDRGDSLPVDGPVSASERRASCAAVPEFAASFVSFSATSLERIEAGQRNAIGIAEARRDSSPPESSTCMVDLPFSRASAAIRFPQFTTRRRGPSCQPSARARRATRRKRAASGAVAAPSKS